MGREQEHVITITPYPFFDPYPYNPNRTTYTAYCSCGRYKSLTSTNKEKVVQHGQAHVTGKERKYFQYNPAKAGSDRRNSHGEGIEKSSHKPKQANSAD